MPWLRELELARLLLDRAGEGAALEAEELGLQELGGSAAQFTLTKGRVAPRRCRVNGARHELLAGAALAADEHRDIGVGDPAR